MRYLITGAGQIGSQLAYDLTAAGHEVTVLRRSGTAPAGASLILGDAGDRDILARAAAGSAAIFHCIHAPYAAAAWRRELPHRERTVMDVAAELGIPVVFPESVYAFGRGLAPLHDSQPTAPVSPLGQVRSELLAARSQHSARTASVVAGDLIGPTASTKGSVLVSTVITPTSEARTPWVLGNPDAPHAATFIPDLSQAMIAATTLAESGGVILLAPSPAALSQRELAARVAARWGLAAPRVRRIPNAAFGILAPFSPTTRELFHQRYLWESASEFAPGRLTTELGLQPTPWEQIIDAQLGAGDKQPAS